MAFSGLINEKILFCLKIFFLWLKNTYFFFKKKGGRRRTQPFDCL